MWRSLQRQKVRQLCLYGLILEWHRNAGLGECLGLVSDRLGTQILKAEVAQEGLHWLGWGALPWHSCRQCSRSLPAGSSVKRAKPEREDFLMPVSWFNRWRNFVHGGGARQNPPPAGEGPVEGSGSGDGKA